MKRKVIIMLMLFLIGSCGTGKVGEQQRSSSDMASIKEVQMLCMIVNEIHKSYMPEDINQKPILVSEKVYQDIQSKFKNYAFMLEKNNFIINTNNCHIIDTLLYIEHKLNYTEREMAEYVGFDIDNHCKFNDQWYKKPINSHCANGTDNYNAWFCNEGYKEKQGECVQITLELDTNNVVGTTNNTCNIKGNISLNSKTKVYYLPNCGRYKDVNIHLQYGERWFCSEQEAINAGFIKSYRCP